MAETDDDDPRAWIRGDESARDVLSRVVARRPFVLLPPLHRVPLRVGNVVEIAGPSPSAKSQVFLQAAVHCVLPKEWKGIHFGGLERVVVYFDLDCRFDVLRLRQILKNSISQVLGSDNNLGWIIQEEDARVAADCANEELFLACMRRFLYIRCYNSSEFVASLKALHLRIEDASEPLGVGIHFLMIDRSSLIYVLVIKNNIKLLVSNPLNYSSSRFLKMLLYYSYVDFFHPSIGAFYWMDRAPPSPALGEFRRNSQSFQNLMETMVQEMRMLLELHPMLVLTTKSSIYGVGASMNSQRTVGKWPPNNLIPAPSLEEEKISYREYMPTIWQAFVTHRIHLQVSDNLTSNGKNVMLPVYTSEWVQPLLNIKDKFTVTDDGIILNM